MRDEVHPGEAEELRQGAVEDGYEMVEPDNNRDAEWLSIARNTYQGSTDYIESSVREQWEKNLYNFRSRHAPDESARKRKMFRPKTRSAIRSHEAALAAALFTNNELTNVEPANKNDQLQAASAKLNQALLQHRLSKTIPWFATVQGAYQDTHVSGVCISKTYWRYEVVEDTDTMPVLDEDGEFVLDEDGMPLGEEVVTGQRVISDQPAIDLIAPENFRFDPNADWRDPVSDSPYLIEMIPMYAGDVQKMMGVENTGEEGAPSWREYSLGEIVSAGSQGSTETTRQAREGDRTDPRDISVDDQFKSVWIHFNVYREDGIDWAFYTIGVDKLLSDPVPLEEYFKLGRETYRVGFSTIESHRNYPAGLAELGENLQNEINTLADQRYENVRLVLNKRYFIRRQGNVDLQSLMRNTPGGGVMVDDPINDVRIAETPDVTSSSYAEQDRLNMDMDEMTGTFSPSTVQSNRSLNETVGGMNLMSTGANTVQEYIIRTFIETWLEPVLSSLVKLEQLFETDETILGIAADKAGLKEQLAQQYGGEDVLDEYIQQDLTVTVNVGMGNTNPEQKLQRLMMAVNTTSQMPTMAQKADWDEITKEVFSYAGYGDGERFLMTDKEVEPQPSPEAQAEQAKAQARLQEKQMEVEAEMQRLQFKEQAETQRFMKKVQAEQETEMMRMAQREDLTLAQLKAKLAIAERSDQTSRDTKAMDAAIHNREANIKERMGSGY